MYTGKRLSVDARWNIVKAHADGAKSAELARKYDVSRWTIYRLLKRYEETGNVDLEFDRCGRRTKLTKIQLDSIRAALEIDPYIRMQELHERLRLPCTLQNLYAIARKMGFVRPPARPAPEPLKKPDGRLTPIWRGWTAFLQK